MAAAGVGGVSERATIGHGLTDDEALVEIAEILEPLLSAQRQSALDYALSRYLGDPTAEADAEAVAVLLVRAGAHPERARAIQAAHGTCDGFVVK